MSSHAAPAGGTAPAGGAIPSKLGVITRFELAEALRSRLITVVVALYGAGAALGAYTFSRALAAAEATVRDSDLAMSMGGALPDDVVRRYALPKVLAFFVHDEALLNELLGVEPLAIFYGFMAQSFVPLLVLVTSGGVHAADIASGATRFVLTRSDRLTWSLGKFLGHALLLALGLLVGALATGLVAFFRGGMPASSAFWLLRAAFRAWVFGLAYLGIFTSVSLWSRQPARARALSVVLLFVLWVGHAISESSFLIAQFPPLQYLAWLFPAQYEPLLWSPSWSTSLPAMLALVCIAAAAFASGQLRFQRSDA
jgi:ABC-type transport system involved in multi-copper enzyme maturation permease subunit